MADEINQQIQEYIAATQAAFTTISTSLDAIVTSTGNISTSVANIASDEVNLAKMIKDLQDQIAAGGGTLNQVTKDALAAAVAAADQMATRTSSVSTTIASLAGEIQTLADNVPDLPPPPPAGS